MPAQFLPFRGKFLLRAEQRKLSLRMQKVTAPFLPFCLSLSLPAGAVCSESDTATA